MPTKLELLQEAYNRGILPEDKKPLFEEAMRRGLVGKTVAAESQITPKPATVTKQDNFSSGITRSLENIKKGYPVIETAANIATSAYGVPLSGLAGLFVLSNPNSNLDTAAKTVQRVQDSLIYQPKTQRGKELTSAATYPIQKLDEVSAFVGDKISDAGYPNVAAGVRSAISGAPAIVGAKMSLKSPIAVTPEISSTITNSINKAIRPSVVGKTSSAKSTGYYKNAQTAVSEILKNKDSLVFIDESGQPKTGALPSNLNEFAQAIEQTKKSVFKEYDSLAKQSDASANPVFIDFRKTAGELNSIIKSKVLKNFDPETVKYAELRADALGKSGQFTALETQEAIQVLNQTLENFYKNRSGATKGQAVVDALIANDLRNQLDTAIMKTTGQEYQGLKNTYGALKTIEADVVKRSIIDARKNQKGLIDLSDIFSGAEAVRAIMSKDPAAMAGSVTAKGIAKYYKSLNDPNKIIKKMFEDVENMSQQKPRKTSPLMIRPEQNEDINSWKTE